MSWDKEFPQSLPPCMEEINCYVNSAAWDELNEHMRSVYGVEPKIEYSKCSGARGWNVKYKKGSRSLCVLYPDKSCFTCLVCIGKNEAHAAEQMLQSFTDYTRSLYQSTQIFNGARWLMARVTSAEIADDVKKLISTRVKISKSN